MGASISAISLIETYWQILECRRSEAAVEARLWCTTYTPNTPNTPNTPYTPDTPYTPYTPYISYTPNTLDYLFLPC
jgi:hypothetical protein